MASRKNHSLRKTKIYTKIQKLGIEMNFVTIIGPKKRTTTRRMTCGFRNQKSPKITLYQINSVQKPKKLKKNLKFFEKRA